MAAVRPRIRVRKATPADGPALADVHFAAFGPDIMSHLMYPDGVSQDAMAKFATSLFPSAEPNGKADVETIVMVAEALPDGSPDDGSGEIVAFGKWYLNRNPRAEAEWNVERVMTAEMLGEGVNVEAYQWFIGTLDRKAKSFMRGDPSVRKHHTLKRDIPFSHQE